MKITPQRAKFIKGSVGVAAVLFAAGPPLFGIGVALVMTQSDRSDVVNEYNYQCSKYDATDLEGFSGTITPLSGPNSASGPGVPTTVRKEHPPLVGRSDNVINYNSVYHEATIPMTSNIRFELDTFETTERYAIIESALRSSYAYCTKDYCEYPDILQYCQDQYGANAFVVGPDDMACERGECHQCMHLKWNTDFCVIAKPNDDPSKPSYSYIEDKSTSCYYPFDYSEYKYESTFESARPTTLHVTLRKSGDPFMVAQKLTEGSMNFGRYKTGEQNAGWGLVAAGIILTVFELILFYQIWAHYLDFLDEKKAERVARRKVKKASAKTSPKENAEKVASVNGPEQSEFKDETQ